MDELVKQALAKWPNVPACVGWLLLDRRGIWRMRDEAAQQSGARGTPVRHAALLAFINRNYAADVEGCWFFQNGPQRVYVELEYSPWIARLQNGADGSLALTDQAGAVFEPAACWLDEQGNVVFSDAAGGADAVVKGDAVAGDAVAGDAVAGNAAVNEGTDVKRAGDAAAAVTDGQAPHRRIALLHDHDLALLSDYLHDAPHAASGQQLLWNGRVLALGEIRSDEIPRRFGFVRSPAQQQQHERNAH